MALWIAGRPPDRAGSASVRRGAALFAVVHFGLVFHWLLPALVLLTPAGPLLFVAGLALLAALTVVWAEAFRHAVAELRAPLWLALPVTWTGLEWAMAHLPGPLAMPWLGLGTTLTGFPRLVGIGEVVGARGVGFWIALVNGLVAVLVQDRAKARASRILVATGLVLALPPAWGVWRAATLETWSVGRVAIVQPAVPQRVRLDDAVVRDSTFAVLDRLVPRIAPGDVRVALLPEMVLPIEPGSPYAAPEVEGLRTYARELGAPILFGARGRMEGREGGTGGASPYNSAFLVEPRGLSSFRYDKHRLVPVVERALYVPLGVPERFRPVGDFAPGTSWPLADVEGVAFGATICFESAFADVSRALRAAGADVLVNLTNDAWFGAEPEEARTAALWQHPAHLVMRAIETRAGVVRVANTGFSFTVDPLGRVSDLAGPFAEEVVVAEVRTSDAVTPYVRYGDVIGGACVIGAVLLLLSAWRRRLDPSGVL
jgi:apolipoprotein N-acyltransferase